MDSEDSFHIIHQIRMRTWIINTIHFRRLSLETKVLAYDRSASLDRPTRVSPGAATTLK